MKNVQTTQMKVMKMYGTAGLFTVRTIVISKNFETQSQRWCSYKLIWWPYKLIWWPYKLIWWSLITTLIIQINMVTIQINMVTIQINMMTIQINMVTIQINMVTIQIKPNPNQMEFFFFCKSNRMQIELCLVNLFCESNQFRIKCESIFFLRIESILNQMRIEFFFVNRTNSAPNLQMRANRFSFCE
jgi:uncharacterized metal-binding protein